LCCFPFKKKFISFCVHFVFLSFAFCCCVFVHCVFLVCCHPLCLCSFSLLFCIIKKKKKKHTCIAPFIFCYILFYILCYTFYFQYSFSQVPYTDHHETGIKFHSLPHYLNKHFHLPLHYTTQLHSYSHISTVSTDLPAINIHPPTFYHPTLHKTALHPSTLPPYPTVCNTNQSILTIHHTSLLFPEQYITIQHLLLSHLKTDHSISQSPAINLSPHFYITSPTPTSHSNQKLPLIQLPILLYFYIPISYTP